MDNEDRKYSLAELEKYSYRILQQIAKSMCLPSNVKKMYLIQMIHAKKFKSNDELDDIVRRVKQERQQMSQSKKRVARKRSHIQAPEISSTSNSLSPPISLTPKRPGHIVIHCSPDNIRQAIAKYNAKHHYLTRNSTGVRKTYQSPKKSDRILRSFNIKTTKNINDTIGASPKNSFADNMDMFSNVNSVFSVLRPQNVNEQEPRILKPEHCVVKKYVPVNRNAFGLDPERSQLIPVKRNVGTMPIAAKRQRILSGIYPIVPKESKVSYEYLHNVGFRRRDGKIAKINAVVQKRAEPTRNIEVTVQDIINSSISQTFSHPEYVNAETNTSLTYPIRPEGQTNAYNQNIDLKTHTHGNTEQVNDRHGYNTDRQRDRGGNVDINQLSNKCDLVNIDQRNVRHEPVYMERNCEEYPFSVYYHKKIRGEQVRSQRSYQREVSREEEERLPKINSVFSRFNAHTDVTQPIYVQVSNESERFQSNPYTARTNTNLLENLYNFRSPFIVNQPLQQISTTTNTRCVYSTPTIATAVAQRSTALAPDFTANTHERDNSCYSDLSAFPRICELLQYGDHAQMGRDFRCDEELSTSCSSLDDTTSQDLGATVTIPEMVEDALELISQDGDYMERIGMDVRVQCILCSFICPKFLLEYHLRKEHATEILHQDSSGFSVRVPLCARRVLAHDAALYALSGAAAAGHARLALTTLSTETSLPKSGSITICNRLTGEPLTWQGEIQPYPHHLPPENFEGLTVPISKLDLIPNNANGRLLNGELVSQPTELNDMNVVLFVKIFN